MWLWTVLLPFLQYSSLVRIRRCSRGLMRKKNLSAGRLASSQTKLQEETKTEHCAQEERGASCGCKRQECGACRGGKRQRVQQNVCFHLMLAAKRHGFEGCSRCDFGGFYLCTYSKEGLCTKCEIKEFPGTSIGTTRKKWSLASSKNLESTSLQKSK